MKIALIAGRDIRVRSDTDGATIFIYNLTQYLISRGHNVDIYTPKQYKGGTYRKGSQKQTEDSFHINPLVRFIEFTTPTIAALDLTDNPVQYFLNRITISTKEAEFFSTQHIDSYDCIYVFHVAHAFGLIEKNLLPLQKTILFPMMLGSYYRAFMSTPDEYLDCEQKTLQKILHISSPSSAEISSLVSEYGINEQCLFKVNRGYNEKIFTPLVRTHINKESAVHIICANSVRPQKGQLFFISLVEYAKEKGTSIIVHLIGVSEVTHSTWYNKYATTIKKEIAERGITENFYIHPVATQQELSSIMQKCHLAFYPSLTETFGKSSLESVASGLPTIVFDDVPAFAEYITDHITGMQVKRTVHSAYEAIEELVQNRVLYSSISRAGIACGAKFTWSHVLQQLLLSQEERGLPRL